MKNEHFIAGGFRFQLEYKEIMKLLMDKSLYPDDTMFLRELLQNGLDACRLQLALAQESGMADKYNPRLRVLDASSIPHSDSDPESGPYIEFSDNGTGMSLEQVQAFFMRVGRSYYRSAEFNSTRESLRRRGIHIDACSRFGIGFLSCFLVGDRIEVVTYRSGNDPLKIRIEGPRRYFVIERLQRPTSYIPFLSPSESKMDIPPFYTGTRVKIFLRRDAVTSFSQRSAGEILSGYCTNQEFPVFCEKANGDSTVIPPLGWESPSSGFAESEFQSIVQSEGVWNSKLSEILIPYRFKFHDTNADLRGFGSFPMFDECGIISPKRGFLKIGGGKLSSNRFIQDSRTLCKWIRHFNKGASDHALSCLSALQVATNQRGEIVEELRRFDMGKQVDGKVPPRIDSDFLKTAATEEIEWLKQVIIDLAGRVEKGRSWTQYPDEVAALADGNLTDLAEAWYCNGVTDEPYFRELWEGENILLSLFGIRIPNGIFVWDPIRLNGRCQQWIPGGVLASIDAVSTLAPEPSASRLFVPSDRAGDLRRCTVVSIFRAALDLWTKNQGKDEWDTWLAEFLMSWRFFRAGFGIDDCRKFVSVLEEYPILLEDKRFRWVFVNIAQVISDKVIGLFADVGRGDLLKDPFEPVDLVAVAERLERIGVPRQKHAEIADLVSEVFGWDITVGRKTENLS